MFTKIVVGLSKSETGHAAAEHARSLAQQFGATLHVVTAFKAGKTDSADDRADAERLLKSFAAGHVDTTITDALPGDPAEAILQVASEVGADLIVVGNKGMHGARRVLGSVPNTISHKAPCSVLIVNTT